MIEGALTHPTGLHTPKFSVQPRIPAHELLSLNRRVSRKAQTEDQQRCLLDGVDCLIRSAPKVHPRKDHIKIAENYLKERDLRLLVSDKQGGFVVMTSGTFGVKAAQALEKNFIQVKKAALRNLQPIWEDEKRRRKKGGITSLRSHVSSIAPSALKPCGLSKQPSPFALP
ncbi:hypothetical protein HPB50_015249 [Hyalomma asiaticum]|uniref:Uncharacterized protein n=1 Tax=Hyalomma asiaticum TaxID=266040 RepID=A0ACB7SA04_HYAAI|nr:hypothetical protein HPB50_015249 [Hyalomma asiaticum]